MTVSRRRKDVEKRCDNRKMVADGCGEKRQFTYMHGFCGAKTVLNMQGLERTDRVKTTSGKRSKARRENLFKHKLM